MFETLTKTGGYRVDYLNRSVQGRPEAVALYVCGSLSRGQSYSADAKRRLYAGLAFVHEHMGLENLVGVYLDVDSIEKPSYTAYNQMKRDLRQGLFRQTVISVSPQWLDVHPGLHGLLSSCKTSDSSKHLWNKNEEHEGQFFLYANVDDAFADRESQSIPSKSLTLRHC